MALTIQERLKDLCVERGLTLEQLAERSGSQAGAGCNCDRGRNECNNRQTE